MPTPTFCPSAWANNMMTGTVVAILHQEEEGHHLRLEQRAGRSHGPSVLQIPGPPALDFFHLRE